MILFELSYSWSRLERTLEQCSKTFTDLAFVSFIFQRVHNSTIHSCFLPMYNSNQWLVASNHKFAVTYGSFKISSLALVSYGEKAKEMAHWTSQGEYKTVQYKTKPNKKELSRSSLLLYIVFSLALQCYTSSTESKNLLCYFNWPGYLLTKSNGPFSSSDLRMRALPVCHSIIPGNINNWAHFHLAALQAARWNFTRLFTSPWVPWEWWTGSAHY